MSFKSKIREILRVKDEENGDVIITNIFFFNAIGNFRKRKKVVMSMVMIDKLHGTQTILYDFF